MQLENQFNKVADQIEMAKTKRRYILNMALMQRLRSTGPFQARHAQECSWRHFGLDPSQDRIRIGERVQPTSWERSGRTRSRFGSCGSGTLALLHHRREHFDEARPCYVGNRSGKSVVPDHPLDVQAFHSNLAVARDQVIGNFVPVFSAKVSHSSVQTVDLSTLLCPVASALLLATERSLRTPQLRQIAFKKTRVGNFFSVRSRGELREPNVHTDSREHVCDLDRLGKFASHHHEPFVGFTFKAQSLDSALHLTVQTDADLANVLHSQSVAVEPN